MRCSPNSVLRRTATAAFCLVLAGAVGIGTASSATAAPKKKLKWQPKRSAPVRIVQAPVMPIDIGTAVAYERDADGTVRQIL